MFKKLKEKITEEVKSSPQRLHQFTQSVSDKLQDEMFFSIGDDDISSASENIEPGFSNVSLNSELNSEKRRNSNSSLASDVSFLPRYESSSLYHLQSDLDISASEIEDNSSTTSQLGHLSKEQIYSAFQKSQMRYHKYRGRYTDLAKHYKELERNNSKLNSVLVETQDKAIRRVSELKEQCMLEQKAKAHLESALRDELDEKQYKIHSLETKIELIQKNDRTINTDSENDRKRVEQLSKELNETRKEIEMLNAKLQETKASGIVLQSREQESKMKIMSLEKEVKRFDETEKENNLKMAQIKMELHNEILNKDAEILKLKKHAESLQEQNDSFKSQLNSNTKVENLQNQNTNLIEKLEAITQRNNHLESDLLKLHSFKVENKELSENNDKYKEEIDELNKKYLYSINKQTTIQTALSSLKESVLKIKQDNKLFGSRFKTEKSLFNSEFQVLQKTINDTLLNIENARKVEEINKLQAHMNPDLLDFKTAIEEDAVGESSDELIMSKTAEYEEKIEKLQSEIEEKDKSIENVRLKLKLMENEKNEFVKLFNETKESFELKLQKSLEENVRIEKELLELKKSCVDNETKCKILQESVDEKEMQLEALEKAKEKREIEHRQVLLEKDREIEERREEIISTERENCLQEKNMLENQLKSRLDEINKLKVELSNRLEENQSLVQRNVNILNKIEILKRENVTISECNKKIVDLEQEKEHINRQWGEKIQLLEEQKKNDESEASRLKTTLESRENEIKSLRVRSEQDSANLSMQSSQIKDLKNFHSELQKNYEIVFRENAQLCTEFDVLQNIFKKLEMLQNEKLDILRDLESTKSKCSRINDLECEISRLKLELDKTNEQQSVSLQLQSENEVLKGDYSQLENEIVQLKFRLSQITKDNENVLHENQSLLEELETVKFKLEETICEKTINHSESESVVQQQQLRELEKTCDKLTIENDLLNKRKNELEIKCQNNVAVSIETDIPIGHCETGPNNNTTTTAYLEELTALRTKLDEYKILNNSNKSSADYYEDELQKLKVKNEKLNRKLDETLFALNHCAELSDSTENEYLKNIVYNYMLGKESLVLARVIAAVCKFDAKQTEAVLQKEQQKQSMLGQLGII